MAPHNGTFLASDLADLQRAFDDAWDELAGADARTTQSSARAELAGAIVALSDKFDLAGEQLKDAAVRRMRGKLGGP